MAGENDGAEQAPAGTGDEAGTEGASGAADVTKDNSMYEGTGKVVAGTTAKAEQEATDKAAEKAALDEEHGTGAAKEDAKPKAKENAGETSTDEYVKTDDSSVNSVMDILQEREVSKADADKIFGEAFRSGNLDAIDKDALAEKVGQNTADMIISNLQNARAEQTRAQQDIADAVFKVAGNEETWNAAAVWAKTHYSEQDADNLNVMLAAGGKQSELAAKDIVDAYKASGDYTEEAQLLNGDTELVEGKPMDKAEYYKLVDAEHSRVGGPRKSELNALEARRAKGRKLGM